MGRKSNKQKELEALEEKLEEEKRKLGLKDNLDLGREGTSNTGYPKEKKPINNTLKKLTFLICATILGFTPLLGTFWGADGLMAGITIFGVLVLLMFC
jgi:hypothetical protein